ncbi:MAG TPA: hypothetical protein VEA69_18090 [Tepidisphaeraceae bacterium]|nr:hypothetical protein [Tepidisphaeraceae bacterium]
MRIPLLLLVLALAAPTHAADRPLMRDLMGLNVHTVQFKPDLYKPVCRHLRDYHPLDWDTGKDTSRPTAFPFAANRVDWSKLYGQWTKAGYEVDACVMFDNLKPDAWKDPAKDARAYGESFARYFGPSGKQPWVTAVEIGNEPANYSVEQYRTIFENMAKGIRAGDPKMKVVTCAVQTGKPDKWSKPMSAVEGLTDLYDVLNIHSYAMKEGWPTWRRSHPEDPSIPYLKLIEDLAKWRDEHAKGKEVWLTEFGYDATTKKPDPKTEFKKWEGVTDEQQAQWIVRSFLLFSAMPIDRAYLYFFNDKDEAKLHASSGITRDFKPKPSYYAVAHLYKTLGDYRFTRAVLKEVGGAHCYEFTNNGGDRIYVAWTATADGKEKSTELPIGRRVTSVEVMPLEEGAPPSMAFATNGEAVEVMLSGTPVYVRVSAK